MKKNHSRLLPKLAFAKKHAGMESEATERMLIRDRVEEAPFQEDLQQKLEFSKKSNGFTLLEVTMVLAIVALIITGILTTRALMRTAQIQAIISQSQEYSSAVKNFKNKFYTLPGDFAGATALWGASTNCPVGVTAAAGTQTCNGDGDGVIEIDSTNYEHLAAWRHLGLSGFISQNFTGNSFGSTTCNIDIKGGVTSPISKLKGATWNIGANISGTAYTTGLGDQYFPMNSCNNLPTLHALWLGGSLQDDNALAESCAHSQIPVFTGQEAYELDVKFDDKKAKGGKIRAQYNNAATYQTCENAASASGGYRTDATGVNCSLVFIIEP